MLPFLGKFQDDSGDDYRLSSWLTEHLPGNTTRTHKKDAKNVHMPVWNSTEIYFGSKKYPAEAEVIFLASKQSVHLDWSPGDISKLGFDTQAVLLTHSVGYCKQARNVVI